VVEGFDGYAVTVGFEAFVVLLVGFFFGVFWVKTA
jgi:hypothetical protein